jgi:hypothetical protein
VALKLDIEQVKKILTVSDLITSWQVLTQDETADRGSLFRPILIGSQRLAFSALRRFAILHWFAYSAYL